MSENRMSEERCRGALGAQGPRGPGRQRQDGQDRGRLRRGPRQARALRQGAAPYEQLKAHDEENDCGVGDRVLLMETRPLSATKRWRVVEILEKAK